MHLWQFIAFLLMLVGLALEDQRKIDFARWYASRQDQPHTPDPAVEEALAQTLWEIDYPGRIGEPPVADRAAKLENLSRLRRPQTFSAIPPSAPEQP